VIESSMKTTKDEEPPSVVQEPDGTWTATGPGMRSICHRTAVEAALVLWPLWAESYPEALRGLADLLAGSPALGEENKG